MSNETLKAPFPWFGGKSKSADVVWAAFGKDVRNYVEPFFGSGAVLLAAPEGARTETVNDKDALLANFWRAVQGDPAAVARWADWPVNETDLHARHSWLVARKERLRELLEGDPDYYDAKMAGWWVWGLCSWIGGGWCSGAGPWINTGVEIVDRRTIGDLGNAGNGINRKLPHLGDAGRGIKRQLPHLGNAGRGIKRQLPHLGDAGRGIKRQLPEPVTRGEWITDWMQALSERLRDVRVCCGDWRRVCGDSVTVRHGATALFFDPPYGADTGCDKSLYAEESGTVAGDVLAWCLQNGDNPKLRIALCGYSGEHEDLQAHGWRVHAWKAGGGYGGQNRHRERVWFSPACLDIAKQDEQEPDFFTEATA